MTEYVKKGSIQVDKVLANFVENEVLPGLNISAEDVWNGLSLLDKTYSAKNRDLLQKRAQLQTLIDQYHQERRGQSFDRHDYQRFLRDIGYLVDAPESFSIETQNVDQEIATLAGPQLVVPVTNARYALNAANARWGSLYDAFYGTDALPYEGDEKTSSGFHQGRGERVIARVRQFLDETFPLSTGSWKDVSEIKIVDEQCIFTCLNVQSSLQNKEQFVAYKGQDKLQNIILQHNGLHINIVINPDSPIGKSDKAGVSDVVIESALTTIMDCEDSVATVDGEDKTLAYRNWLGLMKGDLVASFEKGGKTVERRMVQDLVYKTPNGEDLVLRGRSLMLVRNVGHLMTNPAVLGADGEELHEGLLDALMTSLIGMHDLQKEPSQTKNSKTGSVYIVKPKMHGPEEVAFTNDILGSVEDILGLKKYTLKMGIMDEERRTTVNLAACIHAAKNRVVFINTGFLDRTGDEIHTSMQAGPMVRKADMKSTPWIHAYEQHNVDVGLSSGLSGRAQIGKGMWAMPDLMAGMLAQKIGHPQSGANTAWVPSPTAATLHALHYHMVNVSEVQQNLLQRDPASLDDILTIPLAQGTNWSEQELQEEVDNNLQGILGYVVRWVDQGVGCSKVPDIHDVGLMEDRATLRISSQHLANWLHHGVVTRDMVEQRMRAMAEVVDRQNAGDSLYEPMAKEPLKSIAFLAAHDLVFQGISQPSGYTEPVLHRRRAEKKKEASA